MAENKTLEILIPLIEDRYESHADFERDLGLKPKTVNNWIRGTSSSYYRILPEISYLLNVTPNYLLSFSERELESDETEILSAYRRAESLSQKERRQLVLAIKNVIDLKVKK